VSTGKYKISGPDDRPAPPQGVTPVQVERWAAGGRGLGRVDGRVWMVVGAVPGDLVLARVVADRGRYVEAIADSVPTRSPARRDAPCPLQVDCGGCPLMVVDESAQREAKRTFIVDALERIGRLTGVAVDSIVPSPPEFGYRNKIELTFGHDLAGAPVLGYHRAGDPSRLVDVGACHVADGRLGPMLQLARAFFLEGPGRTDPALARSRDPVRLVLRASSTADERLVAFRGPGVPFPSLPKFAQVARDADTGLVGVVRVVGSPDRRGGATLQAIAGRSWIAEEILGIPFRVPAATFLQIHAAAAGTMLRHVLDGAGQPARVIELYGGVGGLGLAMAHGGAELTIVEADPEAVACGREAAERAGIASARFVRADVSRFLRDARGAGPPDLLIADPPRSGFGPGVAAAVAALRAPRIVMVSCDPGTMARDVAALTRGGYAVDRVVPFDLFPQTAHVEAVVWLSR
jgi:23S rRNA (uracil1939-C5)-methyltransferase